MELEQGKKFLLKYDFHGYKITEIGTLIATVIQSEDIKYQFEITNGEKIIVYPDEIIQEITNPHDGSTLDSFMIENYKIHEIRQAAAKIKSGIDELKLLLNKELLEWAFDNQLENDWALELVNIQKSIVKYAKMNVPTP